ncbi:hypothetical protein EDD37DRAFT_399942 [Exophiala viscosa]|uniref:uncharacterized protein n=1 Tax=Exophiala viscosa TaxID=2486360 RepID=UPI0021A12439|nr:hypothetical protein EDD37DRAFT_399942 [Exophiala viscosa]
MSHEARFNTTILPHPHQPGSPQNIAELQSTKSAKFRRVVGSNLLLYLFLSLARFNGTKTQVPLSSKWGVHHKSAAFLILVWVICEE